MSICVIDYISDSMDPSNIPNYQYNYVICNENCQVSEYITSTYAQSNDIERLSSPGSYIIKVSNDIQRGFLLAFLCNKLKGEIFSHRPEVVSRTLNIPNVKLLPTPEKTLEIKPNYFQPTPAPSASKKPQDTFDLIYQESLEKYVETILTQQIRAIKIKSAKAQLKNIVDGIVIKNQKKNGVQVNFVSDEVVDAMFNDLENSGIISASMATVTYFDEWIDCFFGKRRGKEFVPKHRNPNIEVKPQRSANQAGSQFVNVISQELLEYIIQLCVQDSRLSMVKSIGELSHLIKPIFNQPQVVSQIPSSKIDSALDRVLSYLLKQFFECEDGRSVDTVIQNLGVNFGTKIVRKF